ncbi:MAG: CoA pyrophosphatase [Rhodospirillales bacterium]|jgi:8-oxo-dGTP pyrophosphatase MutT (NUDIX family)
MTPEIIQSRIKPLGDALQMGGLAEEPLRSDFDLRPDGTRLRGTTDRPLKPAAVLVPIINRPEGPTILLTQRTAHLKKHAGQISFPGGGVEPNDPHRVATALRETQEEIGLDPERVKLLGRLSMYETSTAYGVTPVVGWIEPPFNLDLDKFEVEDVFEAPLSFILDRTNHIKETAVREGIQRWFYVIPYQNRRIWGATAGMLINFVDMLEGQGEN